MTNTFDFLDPAGRTVTLRDVHDPALCQFRACVIHNPTEHHMREWPLHWRDDRGIFERICAHGVGHPDPDQLEFWQHLGLESVDVHGCDYCCVPPGRSPE